MYKTPATVWEETIPLGNGRIGMMPDGGIENEHIVLNDITMWSGSTDPEALDPKAIEYLPKIRELLLKGDNSSAQKMMYKHFRCGGLGSAFGGGKDAPYGSFQLLSDLNIEYIYTNSSNASEEVTDYTRTLSLNNAVASTQFRIDDTNYKREYFASHSDDVLVIRIAADKKKSISFELNLSRPERANIYIDSNNLVMEGQLNDGKNSDSGVRYFTKLEIINKGGVISAGNTTLKLLDADEALIVISTSTDMLDNKYLATVESLLSNAKKSSYSKLINSHIKTYKEKFDRVELNLGEQSSLPTDERLINFQKDNDPSFVALYFQYGRYLMISGTNENSLPLNLQGLWANQIQSPWNGDYHLNINLQMNYWPAEVCNLQELHKPLIDFTKSLVPSGEETAKTFYGADGWVAHMMSNPWSFTAPGEHASWGATNTGGAWLCQHLWEHYAFSGDLEYLRSVYMVFSGASEFFLSSMVEEPKNGWLVTSPSSSPENAFYLPGSKEPVFVCMGPTMDVQIIKELFTTTLAAAELLSINDETVERIKETLPKLPPMQISVNAYLQEWLEDYEEQDPKHRHVSHLYGLHPSNQISPDITPELAEAARITLDRRGDAGTGWSRAWKVNFRARLHDGNRAYKLLKSLLEPAFKEGSNIAGSGTYPNLFCAHPPFQIDGNFGGTAGVAEMLLQSQNGYIHLLPALPDNWADGSFKGLRVRGGAEVNADWTNNILTTASIHANRDNIFSVKAPEYAKSVRVDGKELQVIDGYINLDLKKGDRAKIEF